MKDVAKLEEAISNYISAISVGELAQLAGEQMYDMLTSQEPKVIEEFIAAYNDEVFNDMDQYPSAMH